MAKIRDLKKDVNFLTSEVISQAFFTQYIKPETDEKALTQIIEKAVTMRNETIKAINRLKTKSESKMNLQTVQKDYVKNIFKLLDELNGLKK